MNTKTRGGHYRADTLASAARQAPKINHAAMDAAEDRIGRPVTDQDRARIHNGGPNGWRRECTREYWEKFKEFAR